MDSIREAAERLLKSRSIYSNYTVEEWDEQNQEWISPLERAEREIYRHIQIEQAINPQWGNSNEAQ